MEKIVSLCKRRGFIFQSSEIYGGLNGVWDYGALGVELKRNLKNYWWRVIVHERDDVVGIDGSILTHPAVLKASGHMEGFTDPMVDCLVTGKRFRADQIEPQTGRVFLFAGAVDYTSAETLNRERATPERSIVWSRIDLAPHLRKVFDNFSYYGDANSRSGFIFLTGDIREQLRALGVLVTNKLFNDTSFDSYSAIDVSGRSEIQTGTRVSPAIKAAQEFYRKRGVFNPVVIIVGFRHAENTRDYNPENGSLLTEPRPFNLMFKTGTGSVDARLTSTVISIGSPLGVTRSTGDAPVMDMHVAVGSPADASGATGAAGIGQPATTTKGQVADVRRTTEIHEDEAAFVYLRPETAQSIFVQFKNVLETSRKKLPFGIAQVGKAFRNEINPRNFTFRSREFEQMELEYFCRPEQGMELLEYWKEERLKFYESIGIPRDKLHVRTVPDDERAFYSKGTYDIEYDFPFGRQELEGVAYRTDYDLSQHQKASGKSLEYYDDETKEKFIPHVVEPSAGVDRTVLALICEAYSEDQAPDEKGKMETRLVLRLHPRVAPIKCGVFPLLKNKSQLVAKAKEIVDLLRPHMTVFYDEGGAIGRRYRRQDEIGTPFGVTVDFETLGEKDARLRDTVTLRDRDSMKQERVAIRDLRGTLTSRIR